MSRLTSAITRGAQSGYHHRLDTSDYGELLLQQRWPKCPRVSLLMPFQFLEMYIHFWHPLYIYIYVYIYMILWQNSWLSFLQRNNERTSCQFTSANNFRVSTPKFAWPQSLILCYNDLNISARSVPVANEDRHLVDAFLVPVEPLPPSPAPLKWRDFPSSVVVLMQVEVWAFVVNYGLINKRNRTVKMHCRRMMSAVIVA